MGKFLYLAVFTALLAGCVAIEANPQRDEIGLSAARSAAGTAQPTDADTAKLAWKASQICIHGYTETQKDVEPAEAGQQLIDMKLRCGHYDGWDFDYVHMNWSNLL